MEVEEFQKLKGLAMTTFGPFVARRFKMMREYVQKLPHLHSSAYRRQLEEAFAEPFAPILTRR